MLVVIQKLCANRMLSCCSIIIIRSSCVCLRYKDCPVQRERQRQSQSRLASRAERCQETRGREFRGWAAVDEKRLHSLATWENQTIRILRDGERNSLCLDASTLLPTVQDEADKFLVISRVELYPLARLQTMTRRTEWSHQKPQVHLSRVTPQIKRC